MVVNKDAVDVVMVMLLVTMETLLVTVIGVILAVGLERGRPPNADLSPLVNVVEVTLVVVDVVAE